MIQRIVEYILHIVFPITCCSCHAGLRYDDKLRVCKTCESKISYISGLVCKCCGLPLPDGGEHCFNCRKAAPAYLEFIRSATTYEGIIKDLIHQFKYSGKDYLSEFLSSVLSSSINEMFVNTRIDAVTAVPIHWTKRFSRGYNQSELLAASISQSLNLPFISDALTKVKMTSAQVGLTKEKRSTNLAGSFASKDKSIFKGKNILLIDDVCTTGSTIIECAKTLKGAGAKKVYALTLSRD